MTGTAANLLLLRRWDPWIMSFARRLANCHGALWGHVEDLTQEGRIAYWSHVSARPANEAGDPVNRWVVLGPMLVYAARMAYPVKLPINLGNSRGRIRAGVSTPISVGLAALRNLGANGDAERVLDRIQAWEIEAATSLTRRERQIVVLRFSDGRSIKEVGIGLGISRERVRQLEGKALRKLRHQARIIGNVSKLPGVSEFLRKQNVEPDWRLQFFADWAGTR